MRYLIIFCFTSLLFSCGSDDLLIQEQIDMYSAENGITPVESATGLLYVISEPGGEEKPVLSSEINIAYSGYYIDGEVFDSNDDADFKLSGLIEGWKQGIPLIGRGGKIKLMVPPHLGYGVNPQNGIRRNALLVFDIELFDF